MCILGLKRIVILALEYSFSSEINSSAILLIIRNSDVNLSWLTATTSLTALKWVQLALKLAY